MRTKWYERMFLRAYFEGEAGGGAAGASAGGGAAGGGGTPPPAPVTLPALPENWHQGLPEDLRGEASITTFKDIPTLVKSYVNAQRLVGADKASLLAIPKADAPQSQWDEVFNRLGRPSTADAYVLPKDEELKAAGIDKAGLQNYLKMFHGAGLTQKQGQSIIQGYLAERKAALTASENARTTALTQGEQALKAEFGDKYTHKLDIAKNVFKHFGDDAMAKMFVDTGLANNPAIVKMFVKIGEAMLEDTATGGEGSPLNLAPETIAATEIKTLRADKDFMAALTDDRHQGHKAAVERWANLHTKAYPGKQEE